MCIGSDEFQKDETSMTNYRIKKPLLTVYMPVFNAEAYLSTAIESILSQSYTNFEFIIIDDASTDNSWKIIQKFARSDKRIRASKNKLNLGVSLTSNIAISMARGKLLARMDADDISLPSRLEKQVKFLQQNQNIVAVGGQCVCIDADSKIIGYKKFPTDSNKVADMLFWAIPIQQPSMMINLNLIPKKFAWYDKAKSSAEEVNLLFKLLKFGQIANLPDFLLYYRQTSQSLSHRNPKLTYYLTLQSRIIALENSYQPTFTGIILNLIQFFAITILPSKLINSIWNLVRGISSRETQFTIGAFASFKA